ncbi:threonine synthase [Bordetella holmesii]|uniref:Threonine synthase n=2 Tax=Bordetella holmesii TaxID=35814 RepID=A0A158M023_9BORD|nr:threonine synthase [Bordetella holmesii]AHV91151.1 threonine synthase [Bordetella holmesii ATCC 51541]AIT27252.1 threonine synthase [Bordetella holmesii 44057]EWM42588.1 threonine synthase [Bordetella holmesii 41130]EWM47833.1 threonine synthase [Bordetella holmesii 35009]EWM52000.1 threonine synthase [Bordetella holmesii 70147]
MKYVSTRGGMAPQEFSDTLLEGLAPDGGLAVPQQLPKVGTATLESWRALSYADLAVEVLSLFATDIPREDLSRLAHAAYNEQVFSSEQIVPLRPLAGGLQLLGLSEGPTLAFKDMAMQFLGQVFEYVLTKRGTTLNIVGATSGDTGSAAEYALRGKHGVSVFMLSPHGRMSSFQRAQMYSLQDENIHNIAVKGVFDQAQDIVKALSADLAFKTRYRIGAVNSINWARIASQVVYYFHGWLRATSGAGQEVSFAVPSGNFGNILSGHIARRMGLPVRRLVLATNENNVLEEFFRTGVYRPRAPENTYATSSPSMDISRASNFERFIYDLMGGDGERVRALWQELAEKGSFDLSAQRNCLALDYGFAAGASTHDGRLSTIRAVFDETGVLIDPHTADGVHVARRFVEDGVPMLVLETALPAKFSDTIEEALGRAVPPPAELAGLESLPQRVTVMDCDAGQVRAFIEAHAQV